VSDLQQHLDEHPDVTANVNLVLMDKVQNILVDLKSLAEKHSRSNMLHQFAVSKQAQTLVDQASKWFNDAIGGVDIAQTIVVKSIPQRPSDVEGTAELLLK
jgi:hypothetical protein